MKHSKLIALICALLTLSVFAVGCGNDNAVTVNVTVSAIAEDTVYVNPVKVTIEGTTEEPPTVLDAAISAFDQNGTPCEADEYSILSIGDYADKTEGEYTYFWEYTVNGEKPEEGRANTIQVNENDIIVFTYVQVLTSDLLDEVDS